MENSYNDNIYETIKKTSPEVAGLLKREMKRQSETIELIASENFPSDAVLAACGSVFMNKYTEGYPDRKKFGNSGRYYGGCEVFDDLETYGVEVFQKAFKTDYYFNLQPHSGSSANMIAYSAVLKPGDTILSMTLDNGAHLTHGAAVNFSGKTYNFIFYGLDENGYINYGEIAQKVMEYKPALILTGASAYPRIIDFDRIRKIIDAAMIINENMGIDYHPYFMVDMAHIAGLVAAGEHPSPFGVADIITSTTHKTLRGARGGIVACRPYLASKIDASCFPRHQGGALQNMIAGKIIAAEEACTPEFKDYIKKVIENTKAMADEFITMGYKLTTGGTDNHLFLIDFSETHPWLTGKALQDECDKHNITLNKNCVPGEKRSPKEASGVRIGCAAETTRGKTKEDFVAIAHRIDEIVKSMAPKA